MQVGAAERRSTFTGGAKVPSGRSKLDSIMRKPSSQAADSVPAVATCPIPPPHASYNAICYLLPNARHPYYVNPDAVSTWMLLQQLSKKAILPVFKKDPTGQLLASSFMLQLKASIPVAKTCRGLVSCPCKAIC